MHWELGHLHSRVWPCGRLAFPLPELQMSDECSLEYTEKTELSGQLLLESGIRWERGPWLGQSRGWEGFPVSFHQNQPAGTLE